MDTTYQYTGVVTSNLLSACKEVARLCISREEGTVNAPSDADRYSILFQTALEDDVMKVYTPRMLGHKQSDWWCILDYYPTGVVCVKQPVYYISFLLRELYGTEEFRKLPNGSFWVYPGGLIVKGEIK